MRKGCEVKSKYVMLDKLKSDNQAQAVCSAKDTHFHLHRSASRGVAKYAQEQIARLRLI